MAIDVTRRVVAEAVGTAFLLAAIVGSGVMADRLAAGNVAVALLANSLATGGALVAVIAALRSISGAHLNPLVTIVDAWDTRPGWRPVLATIAAQLIGAVFGVLLAHAMFGEAWLSVSVHDRGGIAQAVSEFVATFGLVAVILGCSRNDSDSLPFAVSAYIVAAYWFTSSTSFANPAVTIARSLTGTFSGIRMADVPAFVAAQALGAAAAAVMFRWLLTRHEGTASS
jgi:glycerol uptake facilitator-like aquaporin